MNKIIMIAVAAAGILFSVAAGQSIDDEITMYMPDGQLMTLPVRVYITHTITWDMMPKLKLSRWVSTRPGQEPQNLIFSAVEVAPNQRWTQEIRGEEISFTGTLLMFDLRKYPIGRFKPMTRVIPAVSWEEESGKSLGKQIVVSADEIYLGNIWAAFGWTAALIGIFVVFVAMGSSKEKKKNYIGLLRGVTGRLSLSQFQICSWTLVIGAMVAMFAFIRLDVPKIPVSLLALMGLSVATSGISYIKAKEKNPKPLDFTKEWSFSDLIYDINHTTGERTLSVSRTQMLFWTVLMLIIFISKSIIGGILWTVPWEMVGLMGISQAGYLSQKFETKKDADTDTQAKKAPAPGGQTPQ